MKGEKIIEPARLSCRFARFLSNTAAKFKMDEEAVGATDNIVTEFATYEDFLDSQITPLDLYYLEVIIL